MEGPIKKSLKLLTLYNESKHNILAYKFEENKNLDQSTIPWTFIPWPQISNSCNSDCLPIKGRHGAS
jgi:hypothetical protein